MAHTGGRTVAASGRSASCLLGEQREETSEVAEEAGPCLGCPRQRPYLPDGAEAQHARGWAAGRGRWAGAGPRQRWRRPCAGGPITAR